MESIKRSADVVIAGGGASGLAAAIEIGMKAPELDVLVIEKMDAPGRKLAATGSGRCNITNAGAEGYERALDFFDEIGLATRSYENGLVYPYSESARDVVNLLTKKAEALGVSFACGEELLNVRQLPAAAASNAAAGSRSVFLLESVFRGKDSLRKVTTQASFVVLAMGGKSGPTYGTIGDGYRIARNLGHSIVTPVPALTSVECAEWADDSKPCAIGLAGTRTKGKVTLLKYGNEENAEGKEVFSEEGEIQFTKSGLSGICVFNMTRHMRYDRASGGSLDDFVILADLYPGGDMEAFLRRRRDSALPGEAASDLLATVLKENVAEYVLASVPALGGRASEIPVSSLSDEDIYSIVSTVHGLIFHPVRIGGWKESQVTMGGVSLGEIDETSAESRLVDGLYITGELADRDFPCGGYNLTNAWVSGLSAADDICAKYAGAGTLADEEAEAAGDAEEGSPAAEALAAETVEQET